MKKILLALCFLALPVWADIPAVQLLPPQGPNGDPCFTSGIVKSSVPVNISTATTTQLVALSANAVIYTCGFNLTTTGATTNTTFQFEYGTGASCGTGTTVLTGTMGANATATPVITGQPVGGSNFQTATGNALCLVSAGTTVSIQGFVTYVQRGL